MNLSDLNEVLQWFLLVFIALMLFRIVMWMGVCTTDAELKARLREFENRFTGDGK